MVVLCGPPTCQTLSGEKMSSEYRVVAVNGSPKAGFGNTSQMTAMLKKRLEQEVVCF